MLFEQYAANGTIDPRTVYSYGPDRADMLPAWCKADYNGFIQSKQKSGLAESTLDMCRSSCLRLLEYLCAAGIGSWEALTPEILKEFHRLDPHSTPEARNAYSSKIRVFLEYLGENGLVPPNLFMAVPSEYAPHVNLVQTLSDKNIDDVYAKKNNADNSMELRDMAMVMLGLRMGLRASDIIKLKFPDISWEHKTISVQQQKTGRFLKLPMPVETGNALYRYIIYGRPDSASAYIFITHRVPYDRLHRGACRKALKNILPDLMQGFHVTRRTFASGMLKNNVTAGRISESLGHSDNSTVMQYLSTDGEKMRMCALPLSGLREKGGVVS
jgi:integrase